MVVSYTVFRRHASLTIVQGRFLKAMVEIKPLSEALKDLKQISSRHQEAIIAGTLEVAMNIDAKEKMFSKGSSQETDADGCPKMEKVRFL